ncbi:MAG: hypothetical protein Q8S13_13450, partial [Dehalococcoidia bacterium]|nr:hypothetical protein [Dehalococcoidia bacterium]
PSEAEAIEDEIPDLVGEIWRTDGFPDLPLEEQVDTLMAQIRKTFVFEAANAAAAEARPAEPLFNGRLAPPMDLPSWIDEDSS